MGLYSLKTVPKKGQATVEFLLIIAVLVPILVFALNTISKRYFGAIHDWLGTEIQARARYGYSYSYYQNGGIMNAGNLSNTKGAVPVTYAPGTYSDPMHPMVKVEEGWKQ